jgi:hypothetical protein
MSQFDVINRNIKHQAQVSNNEYLMLLNIDNLQQKQGKDWYEAIDGMSVDSFLAALSDFVHYSKFKSKGVEKLLKRLQERGFLIIEHLKVQVTDKWRDLVDEWGGYYQYNITDEEQLQKVNALFSDIMTPKTLNVKEYKETVRQFTYEAKKAVKRKILKPEWQEPLVRFESMLKSDFLLKQFFEERLKANGDRAKAPPNRGYTEGSYQRKSDDDIQKEIDARMDWRITLDMTEKQFHKELTDTRFWMMQKGKAKLTEAEAARLKFVMEYVDIIENKVTTVDNSVARKNFYWLRINQLKAEKAAHTAPIAPEVATALAAVDIKDVKKV